MKKNSSDRINRIAEIFILRFIKKFLYPKIALLVFELKFHSSRGSIIMIKFTKISFLKFVLRFRISEVVVLIVEIVIKADQGARLIKIMLLFSLIK